MPDYKIDGKPNRMIVGGEGGDSGDDSGGEGRNGDRAVSSGWAGGQKKGVAIALAAMMLFGIVGIGYMVTKDGDTDPVAEDAQDDAAAGDATTDGDADDGGLTDEEAEELVAILDGIGQPVFTIGDIPPDTTSADGGVTLFGAMEAALREVNTDPAAQPFYPVAWGSMEAREDGSADSWYFSMAQAGQADLTIRQVDVSGDGVVTLTDVVNGADYGFSGQEMFGSYPPGGMDSPGLWAASPHPTTCTTWQNRGLSYYYDEEHGMPVVIFAGNDPSCFPDGPLWLHIDPITGAELDVPGP